MKYKLVIFLNFCLFLTACEWIRPIEEEDPYLQMQGPASTSPSQQAASPGQNVNPAPAPYTPYQGSGGSDADTLTAKGIILGFEEWPNTEEKNLILEKTKKAGLKKYDKPEYASFKTWVFDWPYQRKAEEAEQLCKELKSSALTSLKYCDENLMVSAH